MKKFIYILFSAALITMSCEDEDKLNLNELDFNSGGFVRFTQDSPPAAVGVEAVADLTYGFSVSDANNSVASYDLKLYADLSGVRTDTVDVQSVTSFPQDFNFTATDLATLLGVTVDDMSFGDQFFFTATATTNSGITYAANDSNQLEFLEIFEQTDGTYLDSDDDPVTIGPDDRIVTIASGATFRQTGAGVTADLTNSAGYRQAFEFDFIILCPSVEFDELVGTYDVTALGFAGFFGETNFVREVVLGPGANQITVLGGAYPVAGGEDLILNIDPSNSQISLGGDPALAFSAAAGAFATDNYGDGTTGLAFSCIDRIAITLDFDAFAGNAHAFTLDKQ